MNHQHHQRRQWLLAACGMAAAASFGANAQTTAPATPQSPRAPRKYAGGIALPLYTQLPDNIPFVVGLAKGFFTEQMLDLKPISFSTGPDVIRSVASQTHLGSSSPVSGMVAYGSGFSNIRIVGACLNAPTIAYVVKPDSPIRDVSQLKGKNIGVNAPTSITTHLGRLMLTEAGLDPAKDANLINVKGIADSATALENNVVDCTWSSSPLLLQLIAQGKVRVLYDAAARHPTFTQTALFTDAQFIAENPDVVQQWINAVAKSQEFVQRKPAEAAEIWAKALNVDKELALLTVKKLAPSFTIKLTDEGFQQNMDAALAMGLITKPIARSEIVDSRFTSALGRS